MKSLNIVYIGSSGEVMTLDDVIGYVLNWEIIHPEYANWDFDQITGGVEEFIDLTAYYHIKNIFENKK